MPYDDPSLKEFDNYYQAKSASLRERFFRNLILGEKNELKNRCLIVGPDKGGHWEVIG